MGLFSTEGGQGNEDNTVHNGLKLTDWKNTQTVFIQHILRWGMGLGLGYWEGREGKNYRNGLI